MNGIVVAMQHFNPVIWGPLSDFSERKMCAVSVSHFLSHNATQEEIMDPLQILLPS